MGYDYIILKSNKTHIHRDRIHTYTITGYQIYTLYRTFYSRVRLVIITRYLVVIQ